MTAPELEELQNIRRSAERGLRLAHREAPTTVGADFVDTFLHIINLVAAMSQEN